MAFTFLSKKEEEIVKILIGENELSFKAHEIALERAIDIVSKTVAKSEIEVFRKGKLIKDGVWYLLNIKPNSHETGTDFWRNVISKLLFNQEALIYIDRSQQREQLFLADQFEVDKNTKFPYRFTNVKMNGLIYRSITSDQVIYFHLKDEKIKGLVDSHLMKFAKMINFAMNDYQQRNGLKILTKIPKAGKLIDSDTGKELKAKAYVETLLKSLIENPDVIAAIPENIDVKILGESRASKDTKDIREFVLQIYNDVAMVFGIPLDLFFGKTTENTDVHNQFMTYCIDYYFELFDDVLNAQLLTEKEYLNNGVRVAINKTRTKHIDLIDVASSVDKLFAIGFTHNEIRKSVGWETIDEKWANERYVTKNYENIKTSKGGEE